jgi:hypothetical protein
MAQTVIKRLRLVYAPHHTCVIVSVLRFHCLFTYSWQRAEQTLAVCLLRQTTYNTDMREHKIAIFLCYFASLLLLAWSLQLSWVAPLYADFLCGKTSVLDVAVKGRLSALRVTVLVCWCTQWCRWLRHCFTSQKVAGLIPDVVIWIFHWRNPSGCTMALVSTQPVTEMSIRGICWGWGSRGCLA